MVRCHFAITRSSCRSSLNSSVTHLIFSLYYAARLARVPPTLDGDEAPRAFDAAPDARHPQRSSSVAPGDAKFSLGKANNRPRKDALDGFALTAELSKVSQMLVALGCELTDLGDQRIVLRLERRGALGLVEQQVGQLYELVRQVVN